MEGQTVEAPNAGLPPAEVPIGYGRRAARGFAWTILSSLIVKAVLFAGQIIINWHVSKRDLGLAATAIAASIFAAQIREFGIPQLLLRHPKRFAQWGADAAWLSVMLGFAGGILTIAMTPLVVWFTKSPELTGPLLLLALNTFISGFWAIPAVKALMDLRFGFLARVQTFSTLIATLVGVVLAILGFGPYAVVIPIFVLSVVSTIIGCYMVRIPRTLWPSWSRVRVVLSDGWKMLISLFFFQVVWQCDYLILAATHSQEQVGIYFLAFQLSSQTLTLLSQNLAGVLLPVLGHMSDDPERQRQGFLRAMRFLCIIGIPLCFIQAALAGPLLRLIWHERFVDAIPALTALSIGSAFRLLGVPAANYLLSQGRVDTYMRSAVFSSIVFLAVVSGAAMGGGATVVAIAVAIFYVGMETSIASVALGDGHGAGFFIRGFGRVWKVLAVPLISGMAGGLAGFAVSQWSLPHQGPLVALLLGGVSAALASIGALWMVAPQLLHELLSLKRSLLAESR